MKNHDLTIRHKMLSFGNTLCAAQRSARPKSSYPFYEKRYTYVSPRVPACGIHRLLINFRANLIIYNFQAFYFLHCKKLQNHSSVFFLSFLLYHWFKLTLLENSWTVLKTFIIIGKSVFYLQYSNVESLFCNGFYHFFLTQPSGSCWR